MKKLYYFVSLMLIINISSFAQSPNANSDGWSTVNVQWNPSTYVPDKGDSENFTGLSLGYNEAFSISQSIPLYIEVGLGVQYSFYSKDITEDVAKELGVTTIALVHFFDRKKR